MAKNKGEIEELRIKLALIWFRDNQPSVGCHFELGDIINVGFGSKSYTPLPSSIKNLSQITLMSDADVENCCHYVGATKAGLFDKADVMINGNGVSLKCSSAAKAALVNHTMRIGFEFACNEAGCNISPLDRIIDEYWRKRISGVIKEDVKNTNPNSPFASQKKFLAPILHYFLFKGSGSRLSPNPASCVLSFGSATDPASWKIFQPDDVIDSIWNDLVFSVRSKGMDNNYPNIADPVRLASIQRWTRSWQGKYRGTLHIRL